MVNPTRIYTETGDTGRTALGDMSRVGKTDSRLQAYADVDETNSVTGVAIAVGGPDVDVGPTHESTPPISNFAPGDSYRKRGAIFGWVGSSVPSGTLRT